MPVIQTQGVSRSTAGSFPIGGPECTTGGDLGLGLLSIGSPHKIAGSFVRIPALMWTGVECCWEKCPDAMRWIANGKP